MSIPKKIHYCWFGGNPLPELAKKCIASWKKYCPDYEIVEWNENNFDISSAPLYVREAYEAKKWAFVTDYVRLYAMVNYGGVYMDTDVEVIKPLDPFLSQRAFSGFEDETHIPTGIMACEKDFPLFSELLKYYDTASFYNEDGSMNTTTNVSVITHMCLSRGLVQNNTYQVLDGFALYPRDVFCPIEFDTLKLRKTKNTVTIHWFAGSWLNAEQRQANKMRQKKNKKEARKNFWRYLPNRTLKTVLGEDRYKAIKSKFKK